MISLILAADLQTISAVASAVAALASVAGVVFAARAASDANRTARQLFELERMREQRADLRVSYTRDREHGYLLRARNHGPGTARQVRFEMVDENGQPYIYKKDDDPWCVEATDLAAAARLELRTGQHKGGIWVRAQVSWTDSAGHHETDEVVRDRANDG